MITERLAAGPPIEAAIVAVGGRPGGFVLESAAKKLPGGRYSILGCDPVTTVCVEASDGADPLAELRRAVESYPRVAASPELPFVGGWVGFITYEAGLTIEGIRPSGRDDLNMPLLRFSLYDTAAVVDHASGEWRVVAADVSAARPSAPARLAIFERTLDGAASPPPFDGSQPVCERPESNMCFAEYAQKVRRIHEHILAGDVYQVNLAQRFSTTTAATPLELYRRLRHANPADYSAYLACDATHAERARGATSLRQAVLSASPELFLDLRGERVVTRPIKGTRPRTGRSALDEQRQRELQFSEKDRAELNMIIDLLRNDLGRVCRYGSIRVESAGDLEEHPTVYHRVATISGRLADGRDWYDLLRASLPGGSITGAPKIAACKLINQLEPVRRDVYCGAIGYIGLDRSMCLNVAIRTMQLAGERLCLHAGGGIVADSDVDEEYAETVAKAAGMLRALGVANAA